MSGPTNLVFEQYHHQYAVNQWIEIKRAIDFLMRFVGPIGKEPS